MLLSQIFHIGVLNFLEVNTQQSIVGTPSVRMLKMNMPRAL